MANAIGPMLGASVAAAFGLRIPFLLAGAVFFLAAGLGWFAVPKPQPAAARAMLKEPS